MAILDCSIDTHCIVDRKCGGGEHRHFPFLTLRIVFTVSVGSRVFTAMTNPTVGFSRIFYSLSITSPLSIEPPASLALSRANMEVIQCNREMKSFSHTQFPILNSISKTFHCFCPRQLYTRHCSMSVSQLSDGLLVPNYPCHSVPFFLSAEIQVQKITVISPSS